MPIPRSFFDTLPEDVRQAILEDRVRRRRGLSETLYAYNLAAARARACAARQDRARAQLHMDNPRRLEAEEQAFRCHQEVLGLAPLVEAELGRPMSPEEALNGFPFPHPEVLPGPRGSPRSPRGGGVEEPAKGPGDRPPAAAAPATATPPGEVPPW